MFEKSLQPRKSHKTVSIVALGLGLMMASALTPLASPALADVLPEGDWVLYQGDDEEEENVLEGEEGPSELVQAESTDAGRTYVVRVGYHQERHGSYSTVIRDKASWDNFLSSMGTQIWDDTGAHSVLPRGFADYGEAFFATKKLAVAYADLGSSGYSPQVIDSTQSGNTLSIRYDEGCEVGAFYTCDMSGFVVVVELPASSPVTTVRMTASQGGDTGTQNNNTQLPSPTNTNTGTAISTKTPTAPTKNLKPAKKKTTVAPAAKTLGLTCKSSKVIKASVKGADGKKLTSPAVTYTSKNTKVAAVDKKTGKVTAKLPGKTSIVVKFLGNSAYAASSATVTVTVSKRSSGFTKTSAKNVSVQHSRVKKAAVAVSPIAKPKTVYATKGVTYSKVAGRGSIKVNSKTGKVSVGKGTPKGTYVIKAKVSNKADSYCKAASQTLTFKVIVK